MKQKTTPTSNKEIDIAPSTAMASPIGSEDRIKFLDLLRGFALLGILFMNIRAFGLIFPAYGNPTVYDWMQPIDLVVFSFTSIFFDIKFMTLFSILFGVGILLFSERAKKKTGRSARFHYRRMAALLVIGLLHSYGIWSGDILVFYATFGMIAYLFRNTRPFWLVIFAIIFFIIPTLLNLVTGLNLDEMPKDELEGVISFWSPEEEEVHQITTVFRGGYLGQVNQRAQDNEFMYTMGFIFFGARVLGNILLGMALFKTGVLKAQKSLLFYRRLLWGFVFGLPIIGYGLYQNFSHGWSFDYSFFIGTLYNYWGSFGLAFGYIGLVALWSNSDRFKALQVRLSMFGRMAFTNYLAQSILCTFFFYGIGLGFFGTMGYASQLIVVVAVLSLQLWWSPLWFRRFRYGPMEWLWRTITYWRISPNRIGQ